VCTSRDNASVNIDNKQCGNSASLYFFLSLSLSLTLSLLLGLLELVLPVLLRQQVVVPHKVFLAAGELGKLAAAVALDGLVRTVVQHHQNLILGEEEVAPSRDSAEVGHLLPAFDRCVVFGCRGKRFVVHEHAGALLLPLDFGRRYHQRLHIRQGSCTIARTIEVDDAKIVTLK
jgi:hypothetical protein